MARQIAAVGGFKHFPGRFRTLLNLLLDPDTRCLLWLACRNLLKKFSGAEDGPRSAKKTRTKAAKAG
jgi:hypothetical protein